MKDDSPFVFAGLWKGWKDPANEEWLHTCTIITGEPNEFVREIHTRNAGYPTGRDHDSWFSGEAGREILVPFPADGIERVNWACAGLLFSNHSGNIPVLHNGGNLWKTIEAAKRPQESTHLQKGNRPPRKPLRHCG
jgi:hypothetical protein